jgi:N-methylhydantoinase B
LHRPEVLPDVDLVTYEVLSHRLWHICDEMGVTLSRVSGSPVATEANDFISVIMDECGSVVFMSPYVMYHGVVLEHMVRWTLEHRVKSPGIAEGDMFLCNDPWVGAVHQNDVAVFAPLFHDGRLFGWSGTTIHQVDVGGVNPGSFSIEAQDIFGEVPPIPPIKVVRGHVLQEDVEDIYVRRSRQPPMLQLDLRAQIAANNVAHRRIGEIIEKFGADTTKAVLKEVLERTEETFRARLRELPEGVWRHVEHIEISKFGDRNVYPVHCEMTNRDGQLSFDFTGTHPQVGMINAACGAARAGVTAAILPMIAGDMIWATGAIGRAVSLTNPRGTIVNAEFPAAVSMGSISGTWVVHNCAQITVAKMLLTRPQYRDRVLAGGGGSWPAMQMMGRDQYGMAFVTQSMESSIMGFGARAWADGVNTAGPYTIPAARVPNVEVTEYVWPLLVLYRREVADTGGAGRWRGGAGGNYAYIVHGSDEDMIHVSAAFCVAFPPNGALCGGYPGNATRYLILRGSNVRDLIAGGRLPRGPDDLAGTVDLLVPKSQTTQGRHDVYEITLFGGSGFGDPLDRPPELAAEDVANGYVSRDFAKKLYGVVLQEGSPSVDTAATRARRAEIRRERLGGAEPARIADGGAAAGRRGTVVSEYIRMADGRLECAKCSQELGPVTQNYKHRLLAVEHQITELSPLNRDPAHYVDEAMVFRAYVCPGCGTQIETEITIAGAPPVWDCRLAGSPPIA